VANVSVFPSNSAGENKTRKTKTMIKRRKKREDENRKKKKKKQSCLEFLFT
jgi:hypothetical protein